jgi:hypothetical protein
VSLNSFLDVLAALMFVGLPLVVALVSLWGAIRASSWLWGAVSYVIAVASTWTSIASATWIARCPSQDSETCGGQEPGLGSHGSAKIAIVVASVYAVLLPLVRRWTSRDRSTLERRRAS